MNADRILLHRTGLDWIDICYNILYSLYTNSLLLDYFLICTVLINANLGIGNCDCDRNANLLYFY
jgi:hypothetical protein